jgi:hypothetical protein
MLAKQALLHLFLKESLNRHQWLMPVILATQKAEIRRIEI